METNPYGYQYNSNNGPMVQTPSQYQGYAGLPGWQPRQSGEGQKPGPQGRKPERMPKARAQALVGRFKRGIVVASVLCFGSLCGLVAYQQISTTKTTSSTTNSTSSSSSTTSSSSQDDSNSSSSSNSSSDDSSSRASTQQGSSNFGTNNSSSSPFTGSHTS